MAMTVIWTGMTALSLFCALALGNQGQLAAAALEGAGEAIQLGISMAGVLCLWMGVMAVMQRAGLAGDSLCMLVVCNTASIQLIPTTVAAVRMAAGCQTPFDILPAVWVTSALSVLTGIGAAKLLARLWRD